MSHKLLEHLNQLSQVAASKDIRPLSAVTYPGTHCPLFGAAMTLRMFPDAVMLVIGTEECTYYTKSLTLVYPEFGGLNGRCVSFVMNGHDVTFGCREKLELAAQQLIADLEPRVVFMVTTCVPEMTGEDIDSLCTQLTDAHSLPFLAVHTEHFRCDGHLQGVSNVLKACAGLMKDQERENCVNLLGKAAPENEVLALLKKAGVKTNITLPGTCTLEEIAQAPKAGINLVCAKTALPLAKMMEQQFGIPYVSFFDKCMPYDIQESYEKLFKTLNLPVPEEVEKKREELEQVIAKAMPLLKSRSFVYGHAPVEPFVLTAFLCQLGMIPLLIQAKEFDEDDKGFQQQILEHQHNPYVSSSANLVAMERLYAVLQPDLYLGPAKRSVLLEHKIIGLGLTKGNQELGFALAVHIVESFVSAVEYSIQMKEETL